MDAIDYLELYGFEELSGEIDDLFPEWGISFEEMVGKLLHGEGTEVLFLHKLNLFGHLRFSYWYWEYLAAFIRCLQRRLRIIRLQMRDTIFSILR